MTEKVRFLRHGERASAILFPELGQQPLRAVLARITAEGSPRASATSTTPLILTPRLPLLNLYQEGVRPFRDLLANTLTGPYAQANLDKHELEEKEKTENFTPEELKRLEEAKAEALRKIEMERKKKNIERIQGETDFSPILNG